VIVDVILPCWNKAPALPWVLEKMPQGFRPVVADNGSTDGSGEIAEWPGATVVAGPAVLGQAQGARGEAGRAQRETA
jgi:hypothetical protein